MPEGLWQEAVGLARACEMMPTVRGLKIDYGKLKQRADAARNARLAAPRSRSVPEFVDVGARPGWGVGQSNGRDYGGRVRAGNAGTAHDSSRRWTTDRCGWAYS